MKVICAILLVLMLQSGGAGSKELPSPWKVNKVTLVPHTEEWKQGFTASITEVKQGETFELSADVPLTRIDDYFISDTRMVAIGEAGRAAAVVIFDLKTREKIDWFYCYQPQRISETRIVYVEWYPAHGAGTPKDVILLYDLAKSPASNRLGSAVPISIPAPEKASPVTVGIPIFPESNVLQRSYKNSSNDADNTEYSVAHTFLQVNPKRIAFVGVKGKDYSSMSDYLVIVDLFDEIDNVALQKVEIPKGQLKTSGDNPQFIEVTGIKALSGDSAQLHVPRSKYGVEDVMLNLPPVIRGSR
jgi:hypothetical protein